MIPAESDCRGRTYHSREEAESGFLDFILSQARTALSNPGTVSLKDARTQVLQALLLTRTHRTRRKETQRMLAELAIYSLDLVLADTPAPPAVKVRAYSHLLGECGVSIFGTEPLARKHRRRFPRSLDGAPFLLPSGDSGLRRACSTRSSSVNTDSSFAMSCHLHGQPFRSGGTSLLV